MNFDNVDNTNFQMVFKKYMQLFVIIRNTKRSLTQSGPFYTVNWRRFGKVAQKLSFQSFQSEM